ncbi:MAG TPA: hypothetical protein VMV61_11425 [Patescibacteria group bacterium]|nr:hypothetical protein [Patescibacteria group bacterium]
MPYPRAPRLAAIGFRVKTGRAIAVALAGPASAPRLLFRREVLLHDPNVPQSRQPYHGRVMPFVPAQPQAVARGKKAAQRVAVAAVRQLAKEFSAAGSKLVGAGLVVASNPDVRKIGSSHVRAHALEGILFREVLEAGARACRLPSMLILEREALPRAVAGLRRPAAELRRTLARFGKEIGSPWRAEEKSAALAAWLALKELR